MFRIGWENVHAEFSGEIDRKEKTWKT